jgi:hypothetical protein
MKLLLGLLLLSGVAFGKDDAPAKPKRPPSSEERKHLAYTLQFQPIVPFFAEVSAGVASGVSIGQFVDPNTIVHLRYQAGESCFFEDRCAFVERATTISGQFFVGNSFFLEGGASMHRDTYHPVDNDYDLFDSDARKYHFTYEVETWGPVFALGNQWQFRSFTIGARWFGLYQPLFTRTSRIQEDSPEKYQKSRDEKDELKKVENQAHTYLAMMSLGWSF